MLSIQTEQLETIEAIERTRFERHLLDHVHDVFPRRCTDLGPDTIKHVIEEGIDRAMGYGIISELDISKYINLMFILGFEFDACASEDHLPWAITLLNAANEEPTAKINHLYDVTIEKLSQAEQSETEYA